MWRSVDVVTAGAETTASSSVTRDSASAVSRSASSISLRGAVALEQEGGRRPRGARRRRRRRSAGSRRRWARVRPTCAGARACPCPRGRRGRCGWWTRQRRSRSARSGTWNRPARRGDVLLDDGPQHPFLPWRERQSHPLKRQARNRRTHTSSATYRPFRVTRIVPLCRETNPAAARLRRRPASSDGGHLGERARARRSGPRGAGARGRGWPRRAPRRCAAAARRRPAPPPTPAGPAAFVQRRAPTVLTAPGPRPRYGRARQYARLWRARRPGRAKLLTSYQS